jgi:hypothetical protein
MPESSPATVPVTLKFFCGPQEDNPMARTIRIIIVFLMEDLFFVITASE